MPGQPTAAGSTCRRLTGADMEGGSELGVLVNFFLSTFLPALGEYREGAGEGRGGEGRGGEGRGREENGG